MSESTAEVFEILSGRVLEVRHAPKVLNTNDARRERRAVSTRRGIACVVTVLRWQSLPNPPPIPVKQRSSTL